MFQAAQVLKITEIKPKRYAQLIERGFIKPTIVARGQGTRHEYDEGGVAAIPLMNRLAQAGFSHKEASRIAFDKRVTETLTDQVRSFMGRGHPVRALINLNRVVLMLVTRRAGDELDFRFVDDSDKLAAEFTNLANAELSHVVNLTDIAWKVAERLTPFVEELKR